MSISEVALESYFSSMIVYSEIYDQMMKNHIKLLKKFKIHEESEENKENENKNKENENKEIGEALSDEYDIIRSQIRFELRSKFIEKFTAQHINSFEDLLQFGRAFLTHIHQNHNRYVWIDTPTGVEKSMYKFDSWPILQMIELNHHIFTHVSTNHPTDNKFQNMFLGGYIPLYKLDSFKEELEKTELKFSLYKVHEYYQPEGLELKEWMKDVRGFLIVDPNMEKRDLYLRMIDILKKTESRPNKVIDDSVYVDPEEDRIWNFVLRSN